jgi:prepilin peptidase CpaA
MTGSDAILPPAAFSIVLIVWAAACGFQDVTKLRVSNVLTFGMMALALLVLLLGGRTLTGDTPWQAVLGLLVAMVLTLPGYALGKLGAADAKMLMACGLAMGMVEMLVVFVVGSLLGAGLMILTRLLDRYPLFLRWTSEGPLANFAPRPGKSFPFVACLAVGVLLTRFSVHVL